MTGFQQGALFWACWGAVLWAEMKAAERMQRNREKAGRFR